MDHGGGARRGAARERARKRPLGCGIAAAVVYVGTDLIAAARYPGYRVADQAVSELFAIGAPTSRLVVPLFSVASVLLLAFSAGIWRSSAGNAALRVVAILFAASALDALVLWNCFPMHMRGAERGFTDTMHLILGANPFVWLAIGACAAAFRGGFRIASIAMLAVLLLPAIFAFAYVPALDAGQATPGLGLAERISQYGYQLWQAALALALLRPAHAR